MSLPVIVVNGMAPGPKMGVIAGIHGEEYEGPEGLRRFLAGIDSAVLRGTVRCFNTTRCSSATSEPSWMHSPRRHESWRAPTRSEALDP